MKRLIALFALLVAAAAPAVAQLGVYAGYTTSTVNVANTSRFNGPTFGAYYDFTKFPLVNIGIDARASVLTSDQTVQVTSYGAGPRVVLHVPVVPLRPYAEVLGGIAHGKTGQGFALSEATSYEATFAAGADLHIFPWVDWRVIDYSYSRINAISAQQQSLTTGLVLRIPFS